ncbi:hypothetical protein [Lentzea sp. CA-135723]|uniref:hypothetical protein n=1 Tax=Lentzea sp. CA-135723 TaxID=3239950 RepID=UPI003D90673B
MRAWTDLSMSSGASTSASVKIVVAVASAIASVRRLSIRGAKCSVLDTLLGSQPR